MKSGNSQRMKMELAIKKKEKSKFLMNLKLTALCQAFKQILKHHSTLFQMQIPI